MLVSYLDVSISIFSYKFCTTVFDKRDTFNFHIVNFPFLDSNIPTQPAYGVYISQLIRISRICDEYHKFVERHYLITSRLLQQGFKYSKLCKAFKVFSRRHVDLFCKYGASVKQHIIHDGIGLPIYCVRGLSRHITYRKHLQH